MMKPNEIAMASRVARKKIQLSLAGMFTLVILAGAYIGLGAQIATTGWRDS